MLSLAALLAPRTLRLTEDPASDVDVTASGMTPRKLTNVSVELNRTSTITVNLQVGAVAADVVVQEAPPLVHHFSFLNTICN